MSQVTAGWNVIKKLKHIAECLVFLAGCLSIVDASAGWNKADFKTKKDHHGTNDESGQSIDNVNGGSARLDQVDQFLRILIMRFDCLFGLVGNAGNLLLGFSNQLERIPNGIAGANAGLIRVLMSCHDTVFAAPSACVLPLFLYCRDVDS